MGAAAADAHGIAPPQPDAWSGDGRKPRRDDFASAYAPLPDTGGGNPFEIYDAALDDAGAEDGRWEAEAVGARAEPRPWQPRFYSAYFDVNAGDVFSRLLRSVLPYKPLLGWADREEEDVDGTSVPDLYGPVWVTTTAVLALAVGSSVANFLRNTFHRTETLDATRSLAGLDFSRMWKSASMLYFYVFVFPVVLTLFQCLFARRSLREGAVATHPVLGTIMVYGYSMTPVVIAALIATVPMRMVQVAAMATAFGIGVFVVMLNLWRDVGVEHRSLTYMVRLFAALAHAALGFGLVMVFFV
jgi:protein YIPF1/2